MTSRSGPSVTSIAEPSPKSDDNASSRSKSSIPRVARACSSCSRQKIRCDGSQPCGKCVASGQPSGCQYLPSMRGRTRKRKHTPGHENLTDGPYSGGLSAGGDVANDNREREEDFSAWKRHSNRYQRELSSVGLSDLRTNGGPDVVEVDDNLTTLPIPGDVSNPLAVLVEAASTATRKSAGTARGEATKNVIKQPGDAYYVPVHRLPRLEAPHIMTLISVQEAEQLFNSYFRFLHPHFPVLDREHCSPIAVARRNNFLFNAICLVAARRFHVVLWERLQHEFARFETERLPKEKNIEVVQAHLIYAQWSLFRPERFEQDQSWLRVGLAVRVGLDINLHRLALMLQARDSLPRWILRNILRTWLLVYVVDRAFSAQLGKPPSVRGENAIRLYLELLGRSAQLPVEDRWVLAQAEWTMILSRAMEVYRNEAADFTSRRPANFAAQTTALPDIIHIFARQLRSWREKSVSALQEATDTHRSGKVMIANVVLFEDYARLIIHSLGIQRAAESSAIELPAAYVEYQAAAVHLIQDFDHDIEHVGQSRGCPDFVYTILTYAAASLIKATKTTMNGSFANTSGVHSALDLARKASDILGRSALSSNDLPASQARLVDRLVEIRIKGPSRAPSPPRDDVAQSDSVPAVSSTSQVDQSSHSRAWPATGSNSTDGLLAQFISSNFAQTNASQTTDFDFSGWVQGGTEVHVETGPSTGGLTTGYFGVDDDLCFTDESIWNALLEGTEGGFSGLGSLQNQPS